MSVYTRKDLAIMQAWSLERKIKVTQAKIIEWYYHFDGKVAVSFSGGKDSTVLLDLARRSFPSITAVFVNTGLEYPEIRNFVKSVPNVEWICPSIPFHEVIQQYGYPVISKEVARRIYYARKGSSWAINHLQGLNVDGSYSKFAQRYIKYQYLVDAPFDISEKCCDIIKKRPLQNFMKKNKMNPIIGSMACESIRRQSAYLQVGCNAYSKQKPSSQPLSFWTEQDILSYLKLTKIPYADVYGDIVYNDKKYYTTGAKRTVCMFCMFGVHLEKQPNRFQKMELTHPKQYDYCINRLGCGSILDHIGVAYKNK